jgi:hypothetical protein
MQYLLALIWKQGSRLWNREENPHHAFDFRLSIYNFLFLIPYSPDDLFLILTDGIIEVLNERGEEFGLTRVKSLVVRHAAEPLPNNWEGYSKCSDSPRSAARRSECAARSRAITLGPIGQE